MILQHLCKLRCDLLCCFKLFYQWLDFSPKWELAVASLMGNPMRRRETYETILVDVQVVRFVKETIFRRQIWFTPGFHCADITRKLVFSSNFVLHARSPEFPAFWTRFLRGYWCHVGSADESRRTFHRTRVPTKELLGWTNFPVWHLEGAALCCTENMDASSDHGGGGWWLALAGSRKWPWNGLDYAQIIADYLLRLRHCLHHL